MYHLRFAALIAVIIMILSVGNGLKVYHFEDGPDSETSLTLDFDRPELTEYELFATNEIFFTVTGPSSKVPYGFTRRDQLLISFNISLPPPA